MRIKNISVEGGILDGLNLEFGDRLTVLIGGRGTGKTSIIELIRYVLGIGSVLPKVEREAKEQAVSVLDDGICTISYKSNQTESFISRDSENRVSGDIPSKLKPLIFSQTEIESIGIDQSGRLRLIDDFDYEIQELVNKEKKYISQILSLAAASDDVRSEIREIQERQEAYQGISERISEIKKQQKDISSTSNAAQSSADELSSLSEEIAEITTHLNEIDNNIANGKEVLNAVLNAEKCAQNASIRIQKRSSKKNHLFLATESAYTQLKSISERIESQISEELKKRNSTEEKLKPLQKFSGEKRRELSAIDESAAKLSKELSQLEAQNAELNNILAILREKKDFYGELSKERSELMTKISLNRSEIYEKRKNICTTLNNKLNPNIRLNILQACRTESYEEALIVTLKGSGLKYNETAKIVANSVSPGELIDICEKNNYELLSKLTGIAIDRASRLINSLNDSGLERIAAAVVEDDVSLELLDGQDYSTIQNLSIGQRCTVVLSIVLSHEDRSIIVDQPEDHLDNKFVANTLVPSIRERNPQGQTILSSHNANIPVLGEAQRVILMASDGKHLFIEHAGSLEDKLTVDAISTVMEGGEEAFNKRAIFYGAK